MPLWRISRQEAEDEKKVKLFYNEKETSPEQLTKYYLETRKGKTASEEGYSQWFQAELASGRAFFKYPYTAEEGRQFLEDPVVSRAMAETDLLCGIDRAAISEEELIRQRIRPEYMELLGQKFAEIMEDPEDREHLEALQRPGRGKYGKECRRYHAGDGSLIREHNIPILHDYVASLDIPGGLEEHMDSISRKLQDCFDLWLESSPELGHERRDIEHCRPWETPGYRFVPLSADTFRDFVEAMDRMMAENDEVFFRITGNDFPYGFVCDAISEGFPGLKDSGASDFLPDHYDWEINEAAGDIVDMLDTSREHILSCLSPGLNFSGTGTVLSTTIANAGLQGRADGQNTGSSWKPVLRGNTTISCHITMITSAGKTMK